MDVSHVIDYIASPIGLTIGTEFATLLFVVAGFAFMIGWVRPAKRLIVLALVSSIIPAVIRIYHDQIQSFIGYTPQWMLTPILTIASGIIACWIIWGVVSLCFGPRIGSAVTAAIIIWLIKGGVLALLAPQRGVSVIVRRYLRREVT